MSDAIDESEARLLIQRWMPGAEAARVLAFLDAPRPLGDDLVRDPWGNLLCAECAYPGFSARDAAGPVVGHFDNRLNGGLKHRFLPYASHPRR